jgi:hypothetical protein
VRLRTPSPSASPNVSCIDHHSKDDAILSRGSGELIRVSLGDFPTTSKNCYSDGFVESPQIGSS